MADRGMGGGVKLLFTNTSADARLPEGGELRQLPIELISANPNQPRQRFDDEALAALAASLADNGVLQPVLVRPIPGGTYELIAGERRWRAAGLAGFETVPALVRPHGDAESLELALVENMAREDLNPVEEARACALLVEELGLSREDIGRRVGRSRVAVSNLMRLLDLPDDALDLIADGLLTEGHGRALLLAGDHDARRRLARRAAADQWSVRRTEDAARVSNGERPSPSPRRRFEPAHPDQEAAASELADTLGRAFGAPVQVTPRGGGYRVTVTVESHEDALALAARVGTVQAA